MKDTNLQIWNINEQLINAKVIKIYEDINPLVAERVTSFMDVINSEDPNAVIRLEICTPGGSVLDGLAIIDKMRSISNPIVVFNTGYSASMGTAICAAADYAYGTENTQFMIHEMSSGTQGKFRDMKNSLAFNEKLNTRLMGIIAEKCKKTVEEVMADCVYDKWMNAEEAKAYGLIDEILPRAKKDKKTLVDFKKRIK